MPHTCPLCNKIFTSAILLSYHIKNKDCIQQVCDVIKYVNGLNNTYLKKYLEESYAEVYNKQDIEVLDMLKMFTISNSVNELKKLLDTT